MAGAAAHVPTFDRNDSAADIAAALRDRGAVIVRSVLPPALMDSLNAKLERSFEPMCPAGDPFTGQMNKVLGGILKLGPEFSENLLLNPMFLEMADAILRPERPMAPSNAASIAPTGTWSDAYAQMQLAGDRPSVPSCHHYRVNAAAALQVRQGSDHQPLHREMDVFRPFLEHDPGRPECILASIWAGTDFTRENGATRLVPGSHRWPQQREAEAHEIAQATMPKGSIAFWLGSLLHGAAANRTDMPRTGVIMTMAVNWLTTEENQYLAVPPEIARTLPARAQQLLGYRSSASLGCIAGRSSDNWLTAGT
ncbi:MAG: phytanoyl-CoA dioxygenase family protein [Dehalococcoidia bacterium]